jgi:hypothetical protein
LTKQLYKRDLGAFATSSPKKDTRLIQMLEESLLLEGPLSLIREHVAGVILHMKEVDKTFASMDSYRLVDIFLDKDEEFQGSAVLTDYDLFVLLLGFGEVKNQRLPDLIMQVLSRRELQQKPTWVVLGIPMGQVPVKFTQEVFDAINRHQRVQVR